MQCAKETSLVWDSSTLCAPVPLQIPGYAAPSVLVVQETGLGLVMG